MKIRSFLAYSALASAMASALAYGTATNAMDAPSLAEAAIPTSSSTLVAQQSTLNLAGEGEGTLSIGSRPSQTVTFISVTSQPNQQAEISLRMADGSFQRWGGQVVSRNAGEAQIRLTSAGAADATGTITVRYQGTTLISVNATGTLDGQALSLRFTIADDSVSRPPTESAFMLNQQGQGTFGLQGRPNQTITFASVTVQPNNSAELSIRLTDGNNIRFTGQQTTRTAEDVVLNITASGAADARGTANIRYGPNGSILSLSSNGTLDGQSFFIQFNGQSSGNPNPTPPTSGRTITCHGRMQNGWRYRAEATNQRFTQIHWERGRGESTVSTLRFHANNAQGQPVYKGSFRAATEVTLIDLSGGNPRPSSQISVEVEEWGWSRGNCSNR